jgi:hypothetical protein
MFPFVKKDEYYHSCMDNVVLEHPERVRETAYKTVETLEKSIEKW